MVGEGVRPEDAVGRPRGRVHRDLLTFGQAAVCNPRPKAKRLSGWTIAALVAGIWLWGQIFGFGETETADTERPKPSAPAPAAP